MCLLTFRGVGLWEEKRLNSRATTVEPDGSSRKEGYANKKKDYLQHINIAQMCFESGLGS